MVITELIAKLGFETDFGPLNQFNDKIGETKEGLGEMGAAADAAVEQMKGALTKIRNLLIGFTVVSAGASAGILALIKSAANAGDDIGKTAPLLGLTTEEFQKYRYAAKLAGVENEGFTASTQFLLRTIGEAKEGNEQAIKSFARLGLSVADLREMSTAEVFRAMSGSLEKIPDQATRLAVSMDVLGRSGARLGAFLAKGTAEMDAIMGDVEAFGMFTEESAAQAEAFNDAWDRVKFFFAGMKNELAALTPLLTGILDEFREWLTLNREVIKSGITRFIQVLTGVITRAWNLTKRVVHAFETMIKALGGLENAFWLLGVAILAPLLMLIGPVIALGKATMFLLIPFIRLHTLIALVTFALSALMPIWAIFISAVSALAATKAIGWLVAMAGGYKALAAAVLLPTLAFLAQAAALAFVILLFEDLTTWILGGKSLIGEWLGAWLEVPSKLRKLWQDIKDIFRAGGEFIAAVFRGDFMEAYRLLNAGMQKVATSGIGKALTPGAGGRTGNGLTAATGPAPGARVAGFGGLVPGAYFAGGNGGGPTGQATGGPGMGNFVESFRMVAGPDGQPKLVPEKSSGKGGVTIQKMDLSLALPPGTPQQMAEETIRIVDERLRQQIDHSLQQDVPAGG